MTRFEPVPPPELSRRPGEQSATVPGILGAGGVVSATVGSAASPFWRFIAGTMISRNLVVRQPVDQELFSELDPGASILDSTRTSSGSQSVPPLSWPATGILDTGVQAFYAFRITYDALDGRLYLTRSSGSSPESGVLSGAYLAANNECVRYYTVAERMLAASPPAHPGDLRSLERRAAYQMSHWATLSLSADRGLARVRLPGSAERLWQQALASDRAGARVMLATAPRLTSYRTQKSYRSAWGRYTALYNRAEAGWNQNMKALGLGGCDP